ncbi:hypothetical protein ABBQ38_008660 [Trebouxia sp. C0009 RCD-2024]
MTGVLGIQFDSHKEELEKARHQEAKEAEGDELQVLVLQQINGVDVPGSIGTLHDLLTRDPHLPSRTLQLHLTLPEGREETIAAKLGQTVQYTKAVLHERFDVPIDKQV